MPAIATPKVLPATKPGQSSSTSTFNVKSEQDCHDLFSREVSALPEREVPAASHESSPTDSRVNFLPRQSSKTDGTTTNVWIARTVKSAMADILTGP
ncbi:hypothetical protein BKA56DRAFT_673386 [Ilyonectria sp. MPI-CAGE-AT-0026]|nr:hypothetical protein BKA56DRAFT_673386 [Ilyonectria sp. MPI-CAGE-AT-0026]